MASEAAPARFAPLTASYVPLGRGLEAMGADTTGLAVAVASGLGLAVTHGLSWRACRTCGTASCSTD